MRAAVLATVAIGIGFGIASVSGVGSRQPVTGDEAIILSVSETLARESRLGAPIFAGVGNAERHYFASLPLIHVLHWPVLRVFGAGMRQARVVSVLLVLAGVTVLSVQVWRGGNDVAALTLVVALLLWRSDLIGVGWGLPLHSVARSARYDGAQVAWLALSVAGLRWWLIRPTRWRGLLLGGIAGASVLTHFLGVIAPATILLSWIFAGGDRPGWRRSAWVVLGFFVVLAPYAAFLLVNRADAAAQFAAIHAARADAAIGGAAALRNLLGEPDRYAHLLRTPSPGTLITLLCMPVVAWWIRRNWSGRDSLWARVAAANLVAALGLLLLFEPTKAPLYALPLIVPVSLVLAHAAGNAYAGGGLQRRLLGVILLAVCMEGAAAVALDWRAGRATRTYNDISSAIADATRNGGPAVGATRWWWSQRERGYVPFVTLRYRARLEAPGGSESGLGRVWATAGIGYVLRTPEFDADVERSGIGDAELVARVLRECGRSVLRFDDSTWGPVEVFALSRPCPALPGS
jgi:hypothetical protein